MMGETLEERIKRAIVNLLSDYDIDTDGDIIVGYGCGSSVAFVNNTATGESVHIIVTEEGHLR